MFSGGVLLWDIKRIIEDCCRIGKNVFAQTISQMDVIINSVFQAMGFDGGLGPYVFGSEEEVFTAYSYEVLKNNAPNTPLCILPSEYNVVYFWLFVDKPSSVFIIHWDSMDKPWASNSGNINGVLHSCCKSITLEGENITFVIPKESEAEHYFLSLFATPEEGHALLGHYFPCLLENSPEGKNLAIPTKEMLFFLRQVLLWKETAARFFMDLEKNCLTSSEMASRLGAEGGSKRHV
ncbi:MAG: hypothetical protein LBF34_00655 [Puniceicoccales bacterium]|jgi:hypothetical protein|nr:hypothetical protein [Puniceicoccales bacterium]